MTSNRRQFIEKSVGIVGGLNCLASACQVPAEERPEVDPQALKQLSTKLRGTLVLSNDAEFENSRRVFYWNPQTQRKRTEPSIGILAPGARAIRVLQSA